MEILRKLVMRMIMLGARDRMVTRSRSWREKATSCPDSGFRMVRSIKGITGSAGASGIAMVPGGDISGKGRVWAAAEKGNQGRRSKNSPARARGALIGP
jgi:hypothetical protein